MKWTWNIQSGYCHSANIFSNDSFEYITTKWKPPKVLMEMGCVEVRFSKSQIESELFLLRKSKWIAKKSCFLRKKETRIRIIRHRISSRTDLDPSSGRFHGTNFLTEWYQGTIVTYFEAWIWFSYVTDSVEARIPFHKLTYQIDAISISRILSTGLHSPWLVIYACIPFIWILN